MLGLPLVARADGAVNDVTALETVLAVRLEAWRFRKLLGDVELVAGVEAGVIVGVQRPAV